MQIIIKQYKKKKITTTKLIIQREGGKDLRIFDNKYTIIAGVNQNDLHQSDTNVPEGKNPHTNKTTLKRDSLYMQHDGIERPCSKREQNRPKYIM